MLAITPAVGLYCVYLYQKGRFEYLEIPSSLIELPVTRLIAGGAALALYAGFFLTAFLLCIDYFRSRSPIKRFLGEYFLFFVAIGIPGLMYHTTQAGIYSSFLVPLCLCIVGATTPETESGEKKPTKIPETVSKFIGVTILYAGVCWTILALGFNHERGYVSRLCIPGRTNSFVADFFNGKAIVKIIDPATRQPSKDIELIDVGASLKLVSCNVEVVPIPRLTEEEKRRLQREQNARKGG